MTARIIGQLKAAALSAAITIATVGPARANLVTVTLQPVADADVRSDDASTTYNDNTLLVTNDQTHDEYAKAYLRYQLPADFGTAVSAQFSVRRVQAGAWNSSYKLYGLADGETGENWSESSLTWNNAPANLTSDPWQFTSGANEIGSFQVDGSNHAGIAPDMYGYAGASLTGFVNSDTNGQVTLMLSRPGISDSSDLFAAKESDTLYGQRGPLLSLTYTPVTMASPPAEVQAHNRWNAWRRTQDRFPIAAWSYWDSYGGTAAQYQAYADAGLTMAQVPLDQYTTSRQAGLDAVIGSWEKLYLDRNKLDDYLAAPTTDHAGVIGYVLEDEPEPDEFAALGDATRYIYAHDDRGAIPITTLLPNWAWEQNGNRVATYGIHYRDYVETFIEQVNPAVLLATTYPTLADGTDRSDYYANLETIRAASLAHGIGMMGFVIVTGGGDNRTPSESDIRWQVYSNLAYGAKGIWYWNYRTKTSDTQYGEGLVDRNTEQPTARYGYVQEINHEIQNIGDKLLHLRSTAVYHVGDDVPEATVHFPTSGEPGGISALDRVIGSDFLIGEFMDADDANDLDAYLMIVNKLHGAGLSSDDPSLANTMIFTIDPLYNHVYLYDPATGIGDLLVPGTVQLAGGEMLANAYTVQFIGGQGYLLRLTDPVPVPEPGSLMFFGAAMTLITFKRHARARRCERNNHD